MYATHLLVPTELSSGYAGSLIDLYILHVLLTALHMDPEKWRFQSHHSICKAYCLYEGSMQGTMIILAKMLLMMGILLLCFK